MSIKSIYSLPDELVLYIGHCSRRSDLMSLVLVNHHYYQNLAPVLYKTAFLDSFETIEAFHQTICIMRTSLGVHTEVIYVNLPSLDNDPNRLAPLIRKILVSTPRLLDLALRIPTEVTARLLDEFSYPFLLRRLCTSPVSGEAFMSFLRHQPQIKNLALRAPIPIEIKDIPLECNICKVESTILPSLQAVSGWGPSLSCLIPGRPVSTVQCYLIPFDTSLPDFGTLLAKSTAPLTCLNIGLFQFRFSLRDGVDGLLSNLRHCSNSLKDLSFRFSIPKRGPRGPASIREWLEVSDPILESLSALITALSKGRRASARRIQTHKAGTVRFYPQYPSFAM